MRPVAVVGLVFLVGSLGCAADARETSAASQSEVSASDTADENRPGVDAAFLDEQLQTVASIVEARAQGHTYIAMSRHVASFEPPLTNPLAGSTRRAALAECAIYGGGAGTGTGAAAENLDKYLDRGTREELAALLDEALGTTKIFRIANLPVGDAGDHFRSKCTIVVERTAASFTLLQGHGRDPAP